MSSFSATGRSQRSPATSPRHDDSTSPKSTDADGQAVPDPDDLKKDYQWITIARGKEGRLAFLGFETIWWSDRSDESAYDQNKAFAITDRPVYRPGQAVKFKFWVRNARYDAPPTSRFAGQKFKIRVTNPRGETAFEKTYTADAYGGFDGEFAIPSDASSGRILRWRSSIATTSTAEPRFASRSTKSRSLR